MGAPPFPSHSSIALAIGSAVAGVLEAEFGPTAVCGTYAMLTLCFPSFSDAVAANVDAAVWGGAWFRFNAEAGREIGEDIAAWTLAQREFAVPAPASLALFGLGLAALAAGRGRARTDGRRP